MFVPNGKKGLGVLVKDKNISDRKIENAYYSSVYSNSNINNCQWRQSV